MKLANANLLTAASNCIRIKMISRTLKLTSILLTIACLQVNADASAQNITLHENNASLEKVFNSIKTQTEVSLTFETKLFYLTFGLRDVLVAEGLKQCFKDQPPGYMKIDKVIVVNKNGGLIDVKGKVINEKGEPLNGAIVKVKGTNVGVNPDVKGDFKLIGVNEGARVIINVNASDVEIITILKDAAAASSNSQISTSYYCNKSLETRKRGVHLVPGRLKSPLITVSC